MRQLYRASYHSLLSNGSTCSKPHLNVGNEDIRYCFLANLRRRALLHHPNRSVIIMEYPNNLRRLRDAQKLSQGQVAESLGINQAEYSRIEKGRRRVGTHLAGLAQILKCDEDDILAPDQYNPASHMLSDDIPVYALPEPDGESVRFDMAMTSRIDRPPVLAKAKAAFGMFNCGSAMEPRLRHGDFLFCDPDEPVKDNDIVVLTIERGNRLVAIVREFVGNGVYLRLELAEEQTFGKELKGVAPVISINLAR